jgi:hypothetical protein
VRGAYPYPTLFGDIDVEITAVTVDGAELPYRMVSTVERTVALDQADRAVWGTATLRLSATLPDSEITEGPWADVLCVAVLSESATNVRNTARLKRAADGKWHGTIDLERSRHLSRASLSLVVVGTVDDVPGRVLGSTRREWFVDLRADVPRRQRAIEIVEADFVDGPHEWLRPFKEAPWIVETTGDIPIVYLNTAAVEGLTEVLSGAGSSTAEKVLRDMTASQIAQDAWAAMFHTAIGNLEVDDDGTPLIPGGWHGSVLRLMLPDVMPGRQLDDALFDINRYRVEGFGWSELQTRIQYAAGRRSQIAKKLTNATRAVAQVEERKER